MRIGEITLSQRQVFSSLSLYSLVWQVRACSSLDAHCKDRSVKMGLRRKFLGIDVPMLLLIARKRFARYMVIGLQLLETH